MDRNHESKAFFFLHGLAQQVLCSLVSINQHRGICYHGVCRFPFRCKWRDHLYAGGGGAGCGRGGQGGWLDPCPQEQWGWGLHTYILCHNHPKQMTDTHTHARNNRRRDEHFTKLNAVLPMGPVVKKPQHSWWDHWCIQKEIQWGALISWESCPIWAEEWCWQYVPHGSHYIIVLQVTQDT